MRKLLIALSLLICQISFSQTGKKISELTSRTPSFLSTEYFPITYSGLNYKVSLFDLRKMITATAPLVYDNSTGVLSLSTLSNSALTNSTISGIALGGTLYNLTPGWGLTGVAYNGSAARSLIVDSTAVTTPYYVSQHGGSGGSAVGWLADVRVSNGDGEEVTLSGAQTVNGISVTTGDRVLVWDNANQAKSGIYVVNTSGAWARATDADSPSEIIGAKVMAREGPNNGGYNGLYDFYRNLNNTTGQYVVDTVGGAGTDAIYFRPIRYGAAPVTQGYVDAADGGLQTQINFLQSGKEPLRYKVYRVILRGDDPPSIISTITDDFSDTPVLARTSFGIYTLTSTDFGSDANNVPPIIKSFAYVGSSGYGSILKGSLTAPNTYTLETILSNGTNDDINSIFGVDVEIEIRVYAIDQPSPNFPFSTRPRTLALTLTQSGVDDPTVDAEAVNEVGQYEISYSGTGDYNIHSAGNFTAGKTSGFYSALNDMPTKTITGARVDDDNYRIQTFNAGTPVNDVLTNSFIKIEIYP